MIESRVAALDPKELTDMESTIDEINSFASATTDPRLIALLAEVCRRIEVLEAENENLKQRVLDLESTQDKIVDKINEHAENINKVWAISKRPVAPKGQKTKQRLEKLDRILKERGPRTLGQLEKDLGILPQEMSRLISKLDKRKYEVHKRPGNEREKIVRLRSQIN